MRVDELRAAMAKYDERTLREIVVTLYKCIPKSRKEGGLDELLSEYTREKANPAKAKGPVDFNALKSEIAMFMAYADQQFYYAPNHYVRKEKRSKWRFEVKRFIKDLLAAGGEDSAESARFLCGLYAMLCYACHYYIFSTQNPFSAVGYTQPELLAIVLGRVFYNGFGLEEVRQAVFLTLDSTADPVTLGGWLLHVLIDALKTPDTKEMALSQCIAYREEYTAFQAAKTVFRYPERDDFRKEKHLNLAVGLYLELKLSLSEYEDGIKYFWEHYAERRAEVKLYRLLEHLSGDGMTDLWIREYEKACAKKIAPRESLREEYLRRKAEVSR